MPLWRRWVAAWLSSLQLFDELLEQLRDTALKSVNGDVSACPQVLFLDTTPCSYLLTAICGACGHVDQLDPLLCIECDFIDCCICTILLPNHTHLVVAGDEGGVQDLQGLLFHSMDLPTSCGEKVWAYDNMCGGDSEGVTVLPEQHKLEVFSQVL